MVGVRAVSCQAEMADGILTLQITGSLFLRPPETAPLSLVAVPGFSQVMRKGFDVKIDHWLGQNRCFHSTFRLLTYCPLCYGNK